MSEDSRMNRNRMRMLRQNKDKDMLPCAVVLRCGEFPLSFFKNHAMIQTGESF